MECNWCSQDNNDVKSHGTIQMKVKWQLQIDHYKIAKKNPRLKNTAKKQTNKQIIFSFNVATDQSIDSFPVR